MSVFLDIVRYKNSAPGLGEIDRIQRDELTSLLNADTRFRVTEEDGALVVTFSCAGTTLAAVLEASGILSCRVLASVDLDQVIDCLSSLAQLIPGSVVTDEEGTIY